jgi:hypothetical protein
VTGQWTYVDVKTTGIQRYISRTPRLKGQRGASAWLSWATGNDQVRSVIQESPPLRSLEVDLNPDAGEADGLVSVRLPSKENDDARLVAAEFAGHLRSFLPAVEIAAVWGSGETYLDAYRDHLKGQQNHPPLISLPPGNDFPALASCVECRAAPATGSIDIHEASDLRVCLDCEARYTDRYRRPGLVAERPVYREEFRLLSALGRNPVTGTAQDFAELAALGSADTNRNQIATVYADGNALGDFLDRVSRHGDPELKARVSAAISAATRGALLAATTRALGDQPQARLPVIPHVVGGDDLVASVTADRAWPFVTAYLAEFGQRMSSIDGVPRELLEPVPPTASAGLVFTHASFPFRRATELAAARLHNAKEQEHGEVPAVAWLDVTRDGEYPPPGRRAWTLHELTVLGDALRALRTQVEPSGLASLERLVEMGRPEVSAARLREHGRRLGRDEVLAPFLRSASTAEDVIRMSGALSLARWWR